MWLKRGLSGLGAFLLGHVSTPTWEMCWTDAVRGSASKGSSIVNCSPKSQNNCLGVVMAVGVMGMGTALVLVAPGVVRLGTLLAIGKRRWERLGCLRE